MYQEHLIDQELRRTVIEEYAEQENKYAVRKDRKALTKACIIVFGLFYLMFFIASLKLYLTGQKEEALITLILAVSFQTVLIILCFIIIRGVASKNVKRMKQELIDDLYNTTYHFEDDYLVKIYESDHRKGRRFNIEQIRNVIRDGHIITADFKNETLVILDFYEPPLYEEFESLKIGHSERQGNLT